MCNGENNKSNCILEILQVINVLQRLPQVTSSRMCNQYNLNARRGLHESELVGVGAEAVEGAALAGELRDAEVGLVRRGGVHLGGEGLEGEEEPEHQLVILLLVQGVERPIPLAVEQADAVAVEYVHHVPVVPRRRRRRQRRAYLRSSEELHFSVIFLLRWISNFEIGIRSD